MAVIPSVELQASAAAHAPRGAGYRRYMLLLLMLIYALSMVERSSLGLLMQDMKLEFSLSDTQLGFMGGLAFALFYAVLGIPMARWSDRGDRVKIIGVSTALWALAVGLGGLASSFGQLVVIRIGVAIGEAGCVPPAMSLITDHFNRAERPRALAWYVLGVPIGAMICFFCIGWLNEAAGWRATYFAMSVPGLLIALVAWTTLREPRRATWIGATAGSMPAAAGPTLKHTFATLLKIKSFRHILLAYSIATFFGSGILQWKAVFFIRSFGLKTGELGVWLALIYGVGGVLGAICGGELATRFAAGRERLQLKAMCIGYALTGVLSVGVYLSHSVAVAFVLLALAAPIIQLINGPLFAMIQTVVPDRMRAMSVALIYLVANLVGMGLGPLAAGILSDLFAATLGAESLRWALVVLCPGFLWAAAHLWMAGRTIAADLPQR